MDPFITASAISAGASLLGGLFGGAQQSKSAIKQIERQAELNRENWEYAQSNAHQLEVQDLRAAGLNPILSATGGHMAAISGAGTTQGPSAYGQLGSNLSHAVQSAMELDLKGKSLDNDIKKTELKEREIAIQERNSSKNIEFIEKQMDEIDNRINISLQDFELRRQLNSANIEQIKAGTSELYSRSRKELAEADLLGSEKTKLDLSMKYGSALLSYFPLEARERIAKIFATWANGHQKEIEDTMDIIRELAENKNKPTSVKLNDIAETCKNLFGVEIRKDPSLLNILFEVK